MTILFRAEHRQLSKVRDALATSHTLKGTLVILGDKNKERLSEATKHVQRAMEILSHIT